MKRILSKLGRLAALTLGVGLAALPRPSALADFAFAEPADTLVGTQGLLSIEEFVFNVEDFEGNTETHVGYAANVSGSSEFIAFAVSYQSSVSQELFTFFDGWAHEDVGQASWDAGASIDIDGVPLVLSSLGSFEALFGAEDNRAAIYARSAPAGETLNEDTDHDDTSMIVSVLDFDFFRQDQRVFSEFIAIGTDRSILDRSFGGAPPQTVRVEFSGGGGTPLTMEFPDGLHFDITASHERNTYLMIDVGQDPGWEFVGTATPTYTSLASNGFEVLPKSIDSFLANYGSNDASGHIGGSVFYFQTPAEMGDTLTIGVGSSVSSGAGNVAQTFSSGEYEVYLASTTDGSYISAPATPAPTEPATGLTLTFTEEDNGSGGTDVVMTASGTLDTGSTWLRDFIEPNTAESSLAAVFAESSVFASELVPAPQLEIEAWEGNLNAAGWGFLPDLVFTQMAAFDGGAHYLFIERTNDEAFLALAGEDTQVDNTPPASPLISPAFQATFADTSLASFGFAESLEYDTPYLLMTMAGDGETPTAANEIRFVVEAPEPAPQGITLTFSEEDNGAGGTNVVLTASGAIDVSSAWAGDEEDTRSGVTFVNGNSVLHLLGDSESFGAETANGEANAQSFSLLSAAAGPPLFASSSSGTTDQFEVRSDGTFLWGDPSTADDDVAPALPFAPDFSATFAGASLASFGFSPDLEYNTPYVLWSTGAGATEANEIRFVVEVPEPAPEGLTFTFTEEDDGSGGTNVVMTSAGTLDLGDSWVRDESVPAFGTVDLTVGWDRISAFDMGDYNVRESYSGTSTPASWYLLPNFVGEGRDTSSITMNSLFSYFNVNQWNDLAFEGEAGANDDQAPDPLISPSFVASFEGVTFETFGFGGALEYNTTYVLWTANVSGGTPTAANEIRFIVVSPDAGDDTEPPVISAPGLVRATAAEGETSAVVDFTVTATDDTDPSPSVTCDPPSGSTLPWGTTTVTCTATDASGNVSTSIFQVSVSLPADVMLLGPTTGGAAPGPDGSAGSGAGDFTGFRGAHLAGAGQILVEAEAGPGSTRGLWGGAVGSLREAALVGSTASAEGAVLNGFDIYALSAGGEVSVRGRDASGDSGDWLAPEGGAAAGIGFVGEAAPDIAGARFARFPLGGSALNDRGEHFAIGYVEKDAALGITDANNSGIWSSVEGLVVREGDPSPVAGATYGKFGNGLAANDAGHVLFDTSLVGVGRTNRALFCGPAANPALVARRGDAAPGVAGATFDRFLPASLNGAADVAFPATVIGGSVTSDDNEGVWFHGEGRRGTGCSRGGGGAR